MGKGQKAVVLEKGMMGRTHLADSIMSTIQVLIITGVMTVILMAAIWPLSLKLRDTSIVDVYWGPGFAIIAWTVFFIGNTHPTRSLLIAILVTIWSVRLGILMAHRHLTKTAEDPRYAAMRERGVPLDHTTIYRWAQRYAPELEKRCRPQLKPTNDSYRDEMVWVTGGEVHI